MLRTIDCGKFYYGATLKLDYRDDLSIFFKRLPNISCIDMKHKSNLFHYDLC